MRWELVPATTAGPNPAFPTSASSHAKTTVQPFLRCTGEHRAKLWVSGLSTEHKEMSEAWSRGWVGVEEVYSGLWEAEVPVTSLSLPEHGSASNLALPSQQPAAG